MWLRLHERERSGGLERGELAAARPCSLRVDEGRDTARLSPSAECVNRLRRLLTVLPVDEGVAANSEVVGDARNPVCELPFGDVLREVREQQRPCDRNVEHALVVRDQQIGSVGLHLGRSFHLEARAADPEGPDDRDLHSAGDELLRAFMEEASDAL